MLNYITTGDAALPKLLIAHGLFGQARNWGMITRNLADMRHCVSVDMRNHGDSPWMPRHDYPGMASDLADMLADGAADVLGHSMGGKAAMALALTQPDKVRKLIVADIAPVRYTHDQMKHINAMRGLDLSHYTRRADVAAALNTDPGVAGFLTQSLDLPNNRWQMNLDALAAEMPKILDFPEYDTQFTGPALFLAGADSDYMKPEYRDAIKRLFPKARIAKIPGTGHWLHADKPAEVTAAIRTFLAA